MSTAQLRQFDKQTERRMKNACRAGKKIRPGSEVEKSPKSQLETRITGDPDDKNVVFTDVTSVQIEQKMKICRGQVSDDAICGWLKRQGVRLRTTQKTKPAGHRPIGTLRH